MDRKSIFGDNSSVLKANSPLYQVNSISARRLFLFHEEKDNLVPVDHARNFYNVAQSRFPNAIEMTILNDPLPAGYNYYFATPEQLTHIFDQQVLINLINNQVGSKCY